MVIVIVAFLSFMLGRASVEGIERGESETDRITSITQGNTATQTISQNENVSATPVIGSTSTASTTNFLGTYVASKTGTKYFLPWCAGASQIKDENKIFFNTKSEAEKSGYTAAKNCKGI